AGLGEGFRFEYRHYGPYSESLAVATLQAQFFDLVREEERRAAWGGSYSIFTADPSGMAAEPARLQLIREAMKSDPVALELAATAAFLANEGSDDPWGDTTERKPEKAHGLHLIKARALYQRLQNIETPTPLPRIA